MGNVHRGCSVETGIVDSRDYPCAIYSRNEPGIFNISSFIHVTVRELRPPPSGTTVAALIAETTRSVTAMRLSFSPPSGFFFGRLVYTRRQTSVSELSRGSSKPRAHGRLE